MNTSTYNDLITSSKMYQLVTERLELKNVDTAEGTGKFELDAELMELILDLYNNDEEFQYQKMRKFSIEQVLNYLQASHRLYLTKKLPEIEQSMLHIFSKYGQSHQLLASLAIFFNDYKNRLIAHIKMEEKEFFPYVKKVIALSKGEISKEEAESILSGSTLDSFDDHHGPIEDDLKEVYKIISENSDTPSTPLPYRVFLNQVELFELELRKHAIIEDHVLVPMLKELETAIRADA